MFMYILLKYIILFNYAELRDAFSVFDTDGDGTITSREIEAVMVKLGYTPTKAAVRDIIREADVDGNWD